MRHFIFRKLFGAGVDGEPVVLFQCASAGSGLSATMPVPCRFRYWLRASGWVTRDGRVRLIDRKAMQSLRRVSGSGTEIGFSAICQERCLWPQERESTQRNRFFANPPGPGRFDRFIADGRNPPGPEPRFERIPASRYPWHCQNNAILAIFAPELFI